MVLICVNSPYGLMNYSESKTATATISRLIMEIEAGTSEITDIREYEIEIKASEGTYLLWNASKYYAWLSRCSTTYDVLDANVWNKERPSRKMLRKFSKLIKKHQNSQI